MSEQVIRKRQFHCTGNVVKMNPPYDVEFNARINIAGVFDVNSGNPDEIKKELERMLKRLKKQRFPGPDLLCPREPDEKRREAIKRHWSTTANQHHQVPSTRTKKANLTWPLPNIIMACPII